MRLICIAGRDRRSLVERCLESVRQLTPRTLFYRDPLTTEYDDSWLVNQGADDICSLDLPPDMPPRQRVSMMRCHGAITAHCKGYSSIFFVDSDVVLDSGAIARLDEMSAFPLQHSARSLGNLALYDQPGYLSERSLLLGVSIRSHALGGCLEFPVTDQLLEVAQRGVPIKAAWDSWFCREVAKGRVLTSEISYARHIGMGTGINATRHPELNWQKFTPELEKVS